VKVHKYNCEKNKIRFSKINHILFRICTAITFWVDRSSVYFYIIKSEYRFTHSWAKRYKIIKLQLRLANSWSNYGLHFHELESNGEIIFEDDKVVVRTIPLKHRIYTNGFIRGKKKKTENTNAVQNYEIDKCYFQNIKNGKDVTLDDGRVIDNVELTFDPSRQCVMLFVPTQPIMRLLFH
jgi:ribonuclease Z